MSVCSTDDTRLDRGENETKTVIMHYAIGILDIFFRSIPLQYEKILSISQHINTDICLVHGKHCLYKYSDFVKYKRKQR